ncbi:MAG: cation-translocating P-type ATPase [Candidatus Nanohaloarchaea archaeon]
MPTSEEYYRRSGDDCLDGLDTNRDGLNEDSVSRRQDEYGKNVIDTDDETSFASLFFDHLTEFVSLLLIGVGSIALVTYFVSHDPSIDRIAEAAIIYLIVLINATVGAYQEYRSEETAKKLESMMETEATVLRDGERMEIASRKLVPGDIVELESGDKVPGDIRLLETEGLSIKESVLTGESDSVSKNSDTIDEERPLAERNNMAYMNTYVTSGEGTGVVVGTGYETEMGSIAESAEDSEDDVPFVDEVETTGRKISQIAIVLTVIASIVFMVKGQTLYQVFLLASALIVGSIPAALPVTVTYSLTDAMKKMAHENALVKNLPLLESLGGIDVICTDKTGTLTKNQMTVKKIFRPAFDEEDAEDIDLASGREFSRAAVLANDAERDENDDFMGEPEDIGLMQFVESTGFKPEDIIEDFEQKDFLPFTSERKQVQVLVEKDGERFRYTKGAPEVIIDRCDRVLVEGETEPLDEEWEKKIREKIDQFSGNGLRNLGFSFKHVEDEELGSETSGDIFLGLSGMWDPPKEGIKDSVRTCYNAGIDVKMITGDSKETAVAIAKECGFKNINAVEWEDVKDASDEEIRDIVKHHNVFARMDPELKMKMVDALHEEGERVAITGDGVNDTPPMEDAEVGVAMGNRGSDITRDAADIILLDDNFSTIKDAIKYGRASLSNVRKVANYLLTANLFEVIVLFVSAWFGFTPFKAIQLLWVNFATDIFPAMALGGDPPHPDIMNKKPTGEDEQILTNRIWYLLTGIGLTKVVMAFATFFITLWWSTGDTSILGIQGDLVLSQTAAFLWLGLSHLIRILTIRWDEGWKGFDIFINKWVNYSMLWPLVAFLGIMYTPAAGFFKVVPLPLWTWGVVLTTLALGGILALGVTELVDLFLGGYSDTEY